MLDSWLLPRAQSENAFAYITKSNDFLVCSFGVFSGKWVYLDDWMGWWAEYPGNGSELK